MSKQWPCLAYSLVSFTFYFSSEYILVIVQFLVEYQHNHLEQYSKQAVTLFLAILYFLSVIFSYI